MDQVTAVVETFYEEGQRVLTTHYLSECGCEWIVDMWGNVRRVRICPRDVAEGYPSKYLDQLDFELPDRRPFWDS